MSGKLFLSLVFGVLGTSSGLLRLLGPRHSLGDAFWPGWMSLLAGVVWLIGAFFFWRAERRKAFADSNAPFK